MPLKTKKLKTPIVLIAEGVSRPLEFSSRHDRTLEMLDKEYTDYIAGIFYGITDNLFVYNNPSSFIDAIKKHKHHLVFSLWSGENSRNRMGLIPSICEAYGVKYFGADSYAKFICQDKVLSKRHAKRIGFNIPWDIIISEECDLSILTDIHQPVVIKPSAEGTSIGVMLLKDYNTVELTKIARDYLYRYHQPVIIEEFIPGKETYTCMWGDTNNPKVLGTTELLHESDPDFFLDNIFDYSIKAGQGRKKPVFQQVITNEIDPEFFNKCKKAYSSLGKMDYLRIDSRKVGEKMYFIEYSPTPFFGGFSTLGRLILENESSIPEFITDLCMLSLKK